MECAAASFLFIGLVALLCEYSFVHKYMKVSFVLVQYRFSFMGDIDVSKEGFVRKVGPPVNIT
jgi:hypothetical protein